jgi:hypothetical protein
MSKKSIVFILNLLVLNTASIFSMSEDEKRAIRKELYSNYENDRVNAATLSEAGLTLEEIIDRDIEILDMHQYVLQRRLAFCKSAFKNDLFLGCLWGGSFLFAGFTCGTSVGKISDIMHNDYPSGKSGVWFVDNVAYNLLSSIDYRRFVKENVSSIAKCDPKMQSLLDVMLVTGVATIVCGLLFSKKVFNILDYAKTLYRYIQRTQQRVERDQAIIAQLKEIKHTLAI